MDCSTFIHSIKRRVDTDQSMSSKDNLNDQYIPMSFDICVMEDTGILEFC